MSSASGLGLPCQEREELEMTDETLLMIGTRKGLWLGRSGADRGQWTIEGPHFPMREIYSCLVDARGERPRLLVGASLTWTGPQVFSSDDLGQTWQEHPIGFPEGLDASVERVWQLVPGREPEVVYAGTEPAAVFKSTDRGQTFDLERALWDHPHRAEWGAGFGGQAFHTLLPHPEDSASVTVALSTGGVYQTHDGGASWAPRNRGIRAEFLPEGQQYPEFGQCVHKVTRHPANPRRLFAQNHGGVYRSDDEGETWVSIAEGLPSDFGFPIVVHPHEPDTVFVFPIGGGDLRFPPEGRPRVWRSRDAGETWEALGEGLPESFYVAVMRDAMCTDTHDSAGLYFGGRNGSVWGSADSGETWHQVAANLPDVMVLRAGVVG
jgi:photosystem II stability/assembly factor-like uncharacterized protein